MVVEIFNEASKGRTRIKLKLLNDEVAKQLFSKLFVEPLTAKNTASIRGLRIQVATRAFTMSGGSDNLGFGEHNQKQLVNLVENKWKGEDYSGSHRRNRCNGMGIYEIQI